MQALNSISLSTRVKAMVQDHPPHNRIIEFNLNGFRKRLDKTERRKILLLAHIINLSYLFMIFKYGISLIIDFDFEIKLYLYDLSVILGGIPKYNVIYLIFVWILGLFMNFKFHLSSDKNVKQLLEIFDGICGQNKIFINISDNYYYIQKKLSKVTKLLYKGINIIIITFSEFKISI